ncbi:hypothetical protein B0H65DRAFT_589631 [Neurospora tetraspora]|uniref:Uncharacterized protein n=1 Tax=Neurospora tetraspora TaxID=94610 RepID=A0AAE0MQC0_9PEZI|nr:hypothetical protein B0H65DRAFT_589631 [Neurospora tetraspora]
MDNPQTSSKLANMNVTAQPSQLTSSVSPPVKKKVLTLKEQRELNVAKGKAQSTPKIYTITSTISKPASKNSTRSTPKARGKTPAYYAPKAAMKENVRPSSKFAAKTSTKPSSKGASTITSPIVKKALTLKEQRALYTARQKVVAPVTRQVASKTTAKSPTEPSAKRGSSTSSTSPKSDITISPPVTRKALTLKEQMALYAARGKVAAPVLREASTNRNVAAKSPTEQAVQRYYSSASTSTKASASPSSVGSRTSVSPSSRTATNASTGSSSRGSSGGSEAPISHQSAWRKALAKFEREEAEVALRESPQKKATPAPRTSGSYTLKEQMRLAAAKNAASSSKTRAIKTATGTASNGATKATATSSSTATEKAPLRKKRSREEDLSEEEDVPEKSRNELSGRPQSDYTSRGNKRLKRN